MSQNAPTVLDGTTRAKKHFPLASCLASIALTSLGLVAAAINIQWGAQPPTGDALQQSWLYVQIMLTLMWLLAWPVTAATCTLGNLTLEALAIIAGALPALALAALLSSADWPAIAAAGAQQVSFAMCAIGCMSLARHRRAWIIAAPFLAVMAPLLAYVTLEFFPARWSFWCPAVPALAIHQAAHAADWSASQRAFVISAIYAGTAILLIACHLILQARTAIDRRTPAGARP